MWPRLSRHTRHRLFTNQSLWPGRNTHYFSILPYKRTLVWCPRWSRSKRYVTPLTSPHTHPVTCFCSRAHNWSDQVKQWPGTFFSQQCAYTYVYSNSMHDPSSYNHLQDLWGDQVQRVGLHTHIQHSCIQTAWESHLNRSHSASLLNMFSWWTWPRRWAWYYVSHTKQMIVNNAFNVHSFSTVDNPGPPGPQGPQGEKVTGLLPHHSIKQAQTCEWLIPSFSCEFFQLLPFRSQHLCAITGAHGMDGRAGEHAQPPKPTACQTALWMTAVYGLLHGHITHMYRCTRSTRWTCMSTTAFCAKCIPP